MAKSKKVSIMDGFQVALNATMARVGLLREIRESCPNPSQDFIYCDTDSIHAFTEYQNPAMTRENTKF